MRDVHIRTFGEKLRRRIVGAGFSNVSRMLKAIGINESYVTQLRSGKQRDAGIAKVASIAILLGLRPSELMAVMDEALLNPPALSADTIRALGFSRSPEAYDPHRLALILDVVLDWNDEMDQGADQPKLIALTDALYGELVASDTDIPPLRLRQCAMARVFGVDIPEMTSPPRRRGRPPRSAEV